MTPKPQHPDTIKPLGCGPDGLPRIHHRFTKTRFGWYVGTTHGIAHLESGRWSWTRKGIERKAERLTRKLRRRDTAQRFERVA